MMLILYRIKANIPTILMGESLCGKTSLIIKLNQLLNNGKLNMERINMNQNINDEILYRIIEEKNKKAKLFEYEELWIYFENLTNISLYLPLITEIFSKKTYYGNKLNNNIRLIGECRYQVHLLPQSLLYYIHYFSPIDEVYQKQYIYNIISKLFTTEEKNLCELTTEVILYCHKILRKSFDPSAGSFLEIIRFSKLVEFFMDYFCKKNKFLCRSNSEKHEKNNKLRSIILSIYICYYFRLNDERLKYNFECEIRDKLLKLINNGKTEYKGVNLIDEIDNFELKNEMLTWNINKFSDFVKLEQDFLLDQIELDKKIYKNILLKEAIFISFISIMSNIPLILCGNPGIGKNLSIQLIINSMKGKYSKNKFLELFPKIIYTYFKASEFTSPIDIDVSFEKGRKKLEYYKKTNSELPISLIIFDELELTEKSKNNQIILLNSKLELINKENGVSFIGISNKSLNVSKINRALAIPMTDIDQRLDELIETSHNIVENINRKIKDNKIFQILSRTYFEYKNYLHFIKELVVYQQYIKRYNQFYDNNIIGEGNINYSIKKNEKRPFESIKLTKEFKELFMEENKIIVDFHGYRDFCHLIKGIANNISKLDDIKDNELVQIIINYIERNFGGIEYEINLDFNLLLDDEIIYKTKTLKKILVDYEFFNENETIKLNSVFLFKKLYNLECENEPNLKIDIARINDYNITNCILNNINDINSRFLILEINQSLVQLIYQYILFVNPFKEKISFLEGSTFPGDYNYEYIFKIIRNIQDYARGDNLIIMQNLNQIHPFLSDLYGKNYQIINDQKNIRMNINNSIEHLTDINDKFRIIILIDKRFLNYYDLSFLNKFEKHILSFDKLLDNNLKSMSNSLIEEFNLKRYSDIDINYSIEDLLINCKEEEIYQLIYFFSKKSILDENELDEEDYEEIIDERNLKRKLIDKIYNVLPQDIILFLPRNNIIKQQYYGYKNIFNFKDYIESEEFKKYKISLIYTFTSINDIIDGENNEMSLFISQIRSEKEIKNKIDEIKSKNSNNSLSINYYISIHFDQSNSKNIRFITNFILNSYNKDKYNYILFMHINRNFKNERNGEIYSTININPYINQIFIDNLNNNYSKLLLKDLLFEENIKNILEKYKDELELDKEYNKELTKFFKKELDKNCNNDNNKKIYLDTIQKHWIENRIIKDEIIEKTFKFIDNSEIDENENLIELIAERKIIDIFTVDVATCIVEYIKIQIFIQNLKKVFIIFEDRKIITNLIDNSKGNYKSIDKNLIEEIVKNNLD